MCANINAPSAGGWFGYFTYEYGFCLLGTAGATIVYAALCLISLLFLTNFRLGEWIRRLVEKEPAGDGAEPEPAEDGALERRARELGKAGAKIAGGSRALRPRRGYAARAGTDRARFERAAGQTSARAHPQNHRRRRTARGEPAAPPRKAKAILRARLPPATTEEILGKKAGNREKSARNKNRGTGKS